MEKNIINPWAWQDQYGFVQANDIRGAERIIVCAGQVPVDADGNPLHAGDMEAQLNLTFDNLETVLERAGASLADVGRLVYYTTDVQAFAAAGQVAGERLGRKGCRPASTLLGVAGLFHPDVMIEIEATAFL